MATYQKRINKNGEISYRIRAVNGKNKSGNSKQESITWKPTNDMTPKQIEKELQKVMIKFEEDLKNGTNIDNNIVEEEIESSSQEDIPLEANDTDTSVSYDNVRIDNNIIEPFVTRIGG